MRCDVQTELPVEYRGPNAAEHFLQAVQKEECKIKRVLADPKAMSMPREDWQAYNTVTTCYVCEKSLEGDSVLDHCHITGKCRGAAHNATSKQATSKLRLSPKTTTIPAVFHNLRGYDPHLLMQAISKARPSELHPQQHGEVHHIQTWPAAVHRQCPVPASFPRQAGWGEPG